METERIRLRRVERGDLDLRVKWINDAEVRRTLSFQSLVTKESTISWFERIAGDPSRIDLTVEEKFLERPIGFCGLLNIDRTSLKAELYITIGEKELWGKGYATESHEALERLAFVELGLNRLYSYCLDHNFGTQRVKEKRGWSREGTLRQDSVVDGIVRDRHIYSLLRSEWETRHE